MPPENHRLLTRQQDTECPRQCDAVAWVQGELDETDHESFAQHLDTCPSCRAVALDTKSIIRSFASAPRTREDRWGVRTSVGAVAAAAAAVLVSIVLRESPQENAGIETQAGELLRTTAFDGGAAIEWMESRLGEDGTWDPSSWSRFGAEGVGMHAFALLALTRGAELDPQPARLKHVEEAAKWLVRQQDEAGLIGMPLTAGRFDHPVATLALLESWRLTGQRDLREAADSAVRHIADHQQPHEVWNPTQNAGHRAWTVGALLRAEELGWPDLGQAIARGKASLGTRSSQEFGGDCLKQRSFWTLALGHADPRPMQPADDLFSASVAVLAAR